MWKKSSLPALSDDGLYTPAVGEWSYKKYLRVWMYDEIFANAMKKKGTRVYIDLFAGAGRAELRDSQTIVSGSALLALQVEIPFDRYVFCEKDSRRMNALRERIRRLAPDAPVYFVEGDINENVEQVADLIPPRALSFCFVDPYGVNIRLSTLRRLAESRRLDFLILLALQMDASRNQKIYTLPKNERLDRFLGNSTWREEWRLARGRSESFRTFVAGQYLRAMTNLGYLPSTLADTYEMRTEKGLSIYHLAFFSKNPLGCKLWKEVQKYTEPQTDLLDQLDY